LRLMTPLR